MNKPKLNQEKGEIMDILMVLIAFCLLIFVFIIPKTGGLGPVRSLDSLSNGGPAWQTNNNPTSNYYSNLQGTYKNIDNLNILLGNASYEYQPDEEYITIQNNGSANLNITGLKLKNFKESTVYQVGSETTRYPSDIATIPKGTWVISPTGENLLQDIILKPRELAVITTGSFGVNSPYKISSFKENKCTGYIEVRTDYDFVPSLELNCPKPSSEVGFNNLDRNCQEFLNSFPRCHIPILDGKDFEGNNCNGCVDGYSGFSNSCLSFIKSHFGYPQCIANHQNDSDFSGQTWRVFLGQKWELWAKDRETISLLDSLGKLITSTSY